MATGYTDIAAHYRRQIVDGDLRPGDVMPSMTQVCADFSVSITTANRAYRLLKDEGLTVPLAGVGTIVAHRLHEPSTGVARIDRLERTGREYAPGEASVDHVSMRVGLRDVSLCRELDIEPGDEVIVRRRVFIRAGRREVVALSFIPGAAGRPIGLRRRAERSDGPGAATCGGSGTGVADELPRRRRTDRGMGGRSRARPVAGCRRIGALLAVRRAIGGR